MSEAVNFFKTDLRSMEFTLYEQMKVQELLETERFSHIGREDLEQVFAQCMRFCNEVVGPLNSAADRAGCRFEDG